MDLLQLVFVFCIIFIITKILRNVKAIYPIVQKSTWSCFVLDRLLSCSFLWIFEYLWIFTILLIFWVFLKLLDCWPEHTHFFESVRLLSGTYRLFWNLSMVSSLSWFDLTALNDRMTKSHLHLCKIPCIFILCLNIIADFQFIACVNI